MRYLAALIACVLLSGCVSFKADPRIVGHFTAGSDEAIDIESDCVAYYTKAQKKIGLGIVRIVKGQSLAVRIFGPDSTPYLGTNIVFSADGKTIEVEWRCARPIEPRSSVFTKE